MAKGWAGLATLLLCCASAQVSGQATDPNGRILYQAAFFQQFAPSSALEMVKRVPGFTLDIGSVDVRGFGQAAGNVVINGQRPSSKSDSLDTILARIPASRVARIEVGPGDLFGSEYSGKPQVLNLVLISTGGLAGNATGTVRRDYTGAVLPEGSVSALLRRGASSFNLAVGINNNNSTEEGYDTLTALPSGRQLEYRRKVNTIRDPNGYVSGSWELNQGDNRTAHLNFRAAFDHFDLTQSNFVYPDDGADRHDRLTQRYRQRQFELGGDVTRPLLGGGLKLIGLATRRHRLNRDLSLNRLDETHMLGGYAQDLEDQKDETLARLVWNRSDLLGWSVEAGAEGVVNRLDSNVNFDTLDAGGARTRIDLPVDQAVVKEYRGEAFVNAGRSLSSKARIDLGLTYEASRLTVSGDAKAERVLKFLKPKASFDWRPNPRWHTQLSVSRTVAQLQFEDFISSAELTNDRVNGGNADLVPQRAWEILASVEHPILGDGLVKVEAGYNRISQVQDRILTPQGFDAPGNLGDGSTYILRTNVDAPLGRFGIKGGRLTLSGSLLSTSVEDPYTHGNRHFSGTTLWLFNADFRQDLGKFAWGVGLSGNSRQAFFRLDEIDAPYSKVPYVTAFAEYRPTTKTSLTLGLDNATGVPAFRDRTFFEPDRRNPVPSLYEYRERNKHVVPYVTLKHNFG
ncbi:MAG: hypothetical protein JWP15_2001 [Alphaproteobacteria bacterium]|nr:hypothetical protein [Alphaproteobacteria bacterium]